MTYQKFLQSLLRLKPKIASVTLTAFQAITEHLASATKALCRRSLVLVFHQRLIVFRSIFELKLGFTAGLVSKESLVRPFL